MFMPHMIHNIWWQSQSTNKRQNDQMRNTEMASMSHVKLYLAMNVIKAYNTLCANCRISSGELFFQLIHTKFNLIQRSTIQQICLADNHLFSHVNIFRPSTIKTVKTNSKLLLHSTVCAHLKSSDLLSWFFITFSKTCYIL